MLESPPASAAALPSFLVEDSDFLPSWSKSLSTSPRLGPNNATSSTHSAGASTNAAGLDVFGLDLCLPRSAAQDTLMADASKAPSPLDVSPVLGPTVMSASPAPLEPGQGDDVGDFAGALGSQHRSSFESSFNKYHHAPPTDVPTPQKSPTRRKLSQGDLAAPLSFANVATLPSLSPVVPPTAGDAGSPTVGPQSSAPPASAALSPVLQVPKLESHASTNFAQGLPLGLQRRATLGASADEQDKGKIQAYAKLEFPSFDIYIQKLSVTIGRRPAAPSFRSHAAALPFDDARAAGLSLEDYILSLTDAALVKREEESLASIDPNTRAPSPPSAPSNSAKGKEKAVDEDPFSEFVRSSPPVASSVLAEAPITASALPLLPGALSLSRPTAAPAPPLTDVDLGPLRAVSRQHARLSFDYDVGAWVLEVLGRNGVVVEGKWRAKGQRAILTKKTKIQIAERIFHFVLPTIDVAPGEVDGASEPAVKSAKGKDKSRLRAPGKGTGKGKGKKRASGGHDSSSSLSEVSDSDVALSPLRKPSPELSASPQKLAPAAAAPPPAAGPSNVPPASAPTPASAPAPPRPGPPPPPSRTPSAGKSQVPAVASATPVASSSAAAATVKPRPPLPAKAPATRASKKPKAPPKAAASTASHMSLPRGGAPAPDDDEIEEARARAAMIAQILSGRGVAGMSSATLVRAAAEAQRRQSGKGKAPMRSAGKGPGKGKGLPPRPRRPSNASWDDDSDDSDASMSSDSGDSDHELLIEAFQEAANMGHDIRGGGQGGKHIVKGTPSETSAAAAAEKPPAPSAPATATDPPLTSTPKGAGKMPAKQPRARRNTSASGLATASSNGPAPVASASPSQTPATLSATLPPLPLPALPNPTPSPAPPTPAMLSASSLPPLPELKLSAASPASPALSLPPIPTTTSAPFIPPAPSPSPAEAKSPAVPASNTALPLAPPPVPAPVVAPPPTPAAPAAPPKKRSHKKKVPPKEGAPGAPGEAGAAGAAPGTAAADGAVPAKPRPSPYAPAPLAPGATPPDEAPADNRQAKPPYTYASLIAQAIMNSEHKKLSLHEVYDWIVARWPYFRDNQAGWQNSIRHNLTPARGFLKVVRKADEPGKGSFWEIDPAQLPNFDGHHFRMKKTEGAAAAAAAASADAAASKAAAKATSAPSPSPGPAAAPSPAIVAAVEASTAATAKPKPKPPAPSVSSSASAHKPKLTASAPSSRPSSASPGPQSAAAAAQLAKPLPIVVSRLPPSFIPPTPPPESASAAANDELTASLLANPPIVLHEGKLFLRPEIFSTGLSDARLAELQKMPASAVLPILQAHVVQHFKDKLRSKGGAPAKPAPAKAPKAATKAPKASSKAPRTAAPQKKPKAAASSTASAAPAPSSSTPAVPATATAGTKRAREPDVDLTGSTSTSTSSKPAKVAKKATAAASSSSSAPAR